MEVRQEQTHRKAFKERGRVRELDAKGWWGSTGTSHVSPFGGIE